MLLQVLREQAIKVAKDKSFQNTLGKFEVKFNGAMKQLIDLLQSQSLSKYQLANLAMRLDYSGYYALYFEKNPHLVPPNLSTPVSSSQVPNVSPIPSTQQGTKFSSNFKENFDNQYNKK